MNLLRKLSFSLVFVLAALSLRAQAVIDLSAYIDDETAAQLGDNNAAALKNKISKIITRNGMADAAGLFVVTPTLTITDDGAVDTGMTTLHVLRADLTLSVKNLFEDTVFGSQTISLQANGKSMEACMRSLINKVNVNDARFAKLIGDVQQGIADYYTRQMPKILAKVNSLVAREEYEDAMAALAVIPESVDEYEAVEELKVQVYDKLLAGEVTRAVAQADILVRQGDIDGALELCRACNPVSPNYGEVIRFLNRLDAQAAAAEAAAMEQELRKMDAEAMRARTQQEAVVDDIASGAGADSRLMLASLEEGLAGLDAVPLPALGDTARKMLPALCAAALVFCLLAGVATGANIFYLLAAVALVPLAVSLLARMQGKLRLSAGEVVVRAAARVFAEDAASVRERFAGDAEVLARLDAMQLRLDDALARQASAHAQNRRKVTVIAAVVLICCSAGAGALAVRNHAARKAQAAYAAQPEWVRLRDSYADAAGDDEYAGKDLRIAVVRAMLADGQGAAAEDFFFAHCQGKVGDADCAMLIAGHYKAKKDAVALDAFVGKVSLRYDSDTQKVKSLTK